MNFLSEKCGKGFPSPSYCPYGIKFKGWLAMWRRRYNIPEHFVGCEQIGQIDLANIPSKALQLDGKRVYKKHNPEGYEKFLKEARERVQKVSSFFVE